MSCDCGVKQTKTQCGCLSITVTNCGASFSVCSHDGREIEWVDLTEFLPRVRLIAQGVPDDVALEFINAAAVRFARLTGCLTRRVVLDVQAGVQDYYLLHGEFEQVWRMDQVDTCGGVRWRFQPPDKVWLYEQPCLDVANGVMFHYTALPKQETCKVDRLLFDYYQDGIVAGALAQLLMMRKYEFSDAATAAVYERQFKMATHAALIDIKRNYSGQPLQLYSGRL